MAFADDYSALACRISYCPVGERVGYSAFHLYAFLTVRIQFKKDMNSTLEKNGDYKTLETIGVLALFCLVFSIILDISALIYVSAGLLFIGLFLKRFARIIAAGWMRFAVVLGVLNTRIILAVIFYAVLTPIAFFYRATHGDFMRVREDRSKKTYWHERNHEYKSEDLDKQW